MGGQFDRLATAWKSNRSAGRHFPAFSPHLPILTFQFLWKRQVELKHITVEKRQKHEKKYYKIRISGCSKCFNFLIFLCKLIFFQEKWMITSILPSKVGFLWKSNFLFWFNSFIADSNSGTIERHADMKSLIKERW